ncbi:MAG: hypothetical protein HOI95_11705, partial [Chromatiales bacterium]|nr:hypothetical protein [Chromatiales bacterium]
IRAADGSDVGRISSGGFGPSAGRPVTMGYVDNEHAAIGTELHAEQFWKGG